MLLNTPQCLGRPPPLRTAWPHVSAVLWWRTPHLKDQSQLYKPGDLHGWARSPRRCWQSQCPADRALLVMVEGIGGILTAPMRPIPHSVGMY